MINTGKESRNSLLNKVEGFTTYQVSICCSIFSSLFQLGRVIWSFLCTKIMCVIYESKHLRGDLSSILSSPAMETTKLQVEMMEPKMEDSWVLTWKLPWEAFGYTAEFAWVLTKRKRRKVSGGGGEGHGQAWGGRTRRGRPRAVGGAAASRGRKPLCALPARWSPRSGSSWWIWTALEPVIFQEFQGPLLHTDFESFNFWDAFTCNG